MANDLVIKDFYKTDIFKFDLEKRNNLVEMVINNSISWDYMSIRFTKEELQNFAKFINTFLEN